jgi:hypothetical protein
MRLLNNLKHFYFYTSYFISVCSHDITGLLRKYAHFYLLLWYVLLYCIVLVSISDPNLMNLWKSYVRYVCYVIVAFRDFANASKKYPGNRTLRIIRYTDMHARMQNETLASAPLYVAICVHHFTHVFYRPGINAWLLRMSTDQEWGMLTGSLKFCRHTRMAQLYLLLLVYYDLI